MTKHHARARFVPREDTAGAWEHAEPKPPLPIKYPIHHWSTWKGLTRLDRRNETRVVWITDNGIVNWASAFVDTRLHGMDSHASAERSWQLEMRERELWAAVEPRLLAADPRRAFMMMAGMASEVAWRIDACDDNEKFQMWTDFKDFCLWGVYRHHFGDPQNPRMKMHL